MEEGSGSGQRVISDVEASSYQNIVLQFLKQNCTSIGSTSPYTLLLFAAAILLFAAIVPQFVEAKRISPSLLGLFLVFT